MIKALRLGLGLLILPAMPLIAVMYRLGGVEHPATEAVEAWLFFFVED